MKKRATKRQQLSARIVAAALSEHGIELRDVRLYPAQGRWRSDSRMDVMRFTGFAKWHDPTFTSAITVTVDSWDTMTALLKHGFTMDRATGLSSFELNCKS